MSCPAKPVNPWSGMPMLDLFLPAHATRVVVYLSPFNLRSGEAKIRAFCKDVIGIEHDRSTVFLFTNKSRDSLLLFSPDEDGDRLLVKKLEKGAFLLPAPSDDAPYVIMKPAMLRKLFRA